MKISIWWAMCLVLIVGAGGFAIGRGAAPPSNVTESQSELPRNVSRDFEKARIRIQPGSERIPGSTEAVNWFEAENNAGRLIGRDGAEFVDRFQLARYIAFGPNAIFIELLCMDKPDGHYAIIKINPANGRILDAEFGEYLF
jgi:hypothetical protein